MPADNKYYGEAVREIESGIRRDDLWGRAVARSSGDIQRSHSLYLELLAQQLAIEDGLPSRQQQLEHLQKKATNTFKFLFWWLACAFCCGVLAIGGTALTTKLYSEHLYQAELNKMPDQLASALHGLQEDLSSRGYHVDIAQLEQNWSLPLIELQKIYPFEIAMSISSFSLQVSHWDYDAHVKSEVSSETWAQTSMAAFVVLFGCCVLWRRKRNKLNY